MATSTAGPLPAGFAWHSSACGRGSSARDLVTLQVLPPRQMETVATYPVSSPLGWDNVEVRSLPSHTCPPGRGPQPTVLTCCESTLRGLLWSPSHFPTPVSASWVPWHENSLLSGPSLWALLDKPPRSPLRCPRLSRTRAHTPRGLGHSEGRFGEALCQVAPRLLAFAGLGNLRSCKDYAPWGLWERGIVCVAQ